MKFMIEKADDRKQKFPPTQNSRFEGTHGELGINFWSLEIKTLQDVLNLANGNDSVLIEKIDSGSDMDYCITLVRV